MADARLLEALREFCGPLGDFLVKLASDDGSEWWAAFKKFLRKENSWIPLTPTTYGLAILPPFANAELVADGPGDDTLNLATMRLLPILRNEENGRISFEEAVRRSTVNPQTNWGQRAASAVRDSGNAGKISLEVWPVGLYAICGKTVWRRRDGYRYALCVIRCGDGFYYSYRWFADDVNFGGRLLSSRK